MKIPSFGGVARSAGVGFRINNPHQAVGYGPNPPEVPPCPRGDAVFIERGAALGGMNSYGKPGQIFSVSPKANPIRNTTCGNTCNNNRLAEVRKCHATSNGGTP